MKTTKQMKPLRKKGKAQLKRSKVHPTTTSQIGMQFKTRDEWTKCLTLLDDLGESFDIAGDKTIVVGEEVANRVARQGFQFERLKVVHMLDLPLEKQRQIRAGLPKDEVLKRMMQRVREGFGERD